MIRKKLLSKTTYVGKYACSQWISQLMQIALNVLHMLYLVDLRYRLVIVLSR